MYLALAVVAAAAKLMIVENFILHSRRDMFVYNKKRKDAKEAAQLHTYYCLFAGNTRKTHYLEYYVTSHSTWLTRGLLIGPLSHPHYPLFNLCLI